MMGELTFTRSNPAINLNRNIPIIYVSSLIGISLLGVLLVFVFQRLPSRAQSTLRTSKVFTLVRAKILYAPLFAHRRSRQITTLNGFLNLGSPPSRVQALTILILLAINILLICYDENYTYEKTSVPERYKLRTGAIAVANLIPVVLTSSIHNPLIPLLGVSYHFFNVIHRWLARIVVLEVLAHLLCHVFQVRAEYGSTALRKSFDVPFITYGLVAAIFFFGILIQSYKPVRSLAYEIFHFTHIILVIVAFVFAWFHIKSLSQRWYILSSAVLWAALRLKGLVVLAHRSMGAKRATVSLEYLPGDAVKMTILVSRPWKFFPGQHVYLAIPGLGCFAAHPFSVIWTDTRQSQKSHTLEKAQENGAAITPSVDDAIEGVADRAVYCIVKRREGHTKGLLECARQLSATGKQDSRWNALITGPYGGQHPLTNYATVLLFAGGVGITHQFPHIKSLMEARLAESHTPCTIHLVWAVPGVAVLKWIRPWLAEIQDLKHQTGNVLKMDLYVTRPFDKARTPSMAPFELFEGRPSIEKLVEQVAAFRADGRMCISTCASGSMSDDVRYAARKVIEQGVDLDILEESFGW